MFLKLFSDLKYFISYKKNESFYNSIFFFEGDYQEPYLKYLLNKKKNYAIITLEKNSFLNYENRFYFRTNFFKILFFNSINVKKVYTTTPDLDNSIFKRSKNKNVKYIFIQHSPVGLNMAYDKYSFKNFDAIQVVNKFQYDDLNEINKVLNTRIKPIKSNYYFLKNFTFNKKTNKKILIAPTWNTNFYKNKLHLKIKEILDNSNFQYEIRPHKMSFIKKEFDLRELKKEFVLNTEKMCNLSYYNQLITDWSGIYIEFALINKIKPICINSEKKIRNDEYKKFESPVAEIFLREKLSKIINLNNLNQILKELSLTDHNDKKEINEIIEKYFY